MNTQTMTHDQAMKALGMDAFDFEKAQDDTDIQETAARVIDLLETELKRLDELELEAAELDALAADETSESQRLKMAVLLDVVRATLDAATDEQRSEFAAGVQVLLATLPPPAH